MELASTLSRRWPCRVSAAERRQRWRNSKGWGRKCSAQKCFPSAHGPVWKGTHLDRSACKSCQLFNVLALFPNNGTHCLHGDEQIHHLLLWQLQREKAIQSDSWKRRDCLICKDLTSPHPRELIWPSECNRVKKQACIGSPQQDTHLILRNKNMGGVRGTKQWAWSPLKKLPPVTEWVWNKSWCQLNFGP